MIHSMTGFGKAEGNVAASNVSMQMRSLNSKHLDLSMRFPSLLKEMEGDFRKQIADQLNRGKIELSINVQNEDSNDAPKINKEVFKKYFEQMTSLTKELGLEATDLIPTICRFPEVFSTEAEEIDEAHKKEYMLILNACISSLNEFRASEGLQLQNDLLAQIDQIETQLEAALKFEEARIETVRNRIQQKLDEHIDPNAIDKDRFEQEMIYFMEKFDISEEKVRLRSHCNYFKEVLTVKGEHGKKLNFIAQEIGREINTLGSKANHAEMQKQVVLMKESLEKIKEQVLNIL